MKDFPNEQMAAKALLGESVLLLKQSGIDFVVLGGWLPYLFNQGHYTHPGTFDVDVVLNGKLTRIQVECAAELMEKAGFLPAAKNQFQLYRILKTNGKNTIYHVDFLHRLYAPDQEDFTLTHWNKMQSIAGPGTDVVFIFNERTQEKVTLPDAKGVEHPMVVDFISEVGFLCAKGRSLASPKRIRDAFDIFLVISQSRNPERLLTRTRELMREKIFAVSMLKIRKEFNHGQAAHNALRFIEPDRQKWKENGNELIRLASDTVNDFLDRAGVPGADSVLTDKQIQDY